MVSLKSQKRLAASVLKCGKNRIWLDPNESAEIFVANSRQNIRNLVKDGLIIRKPEVVHSRSRFLDRLAAKRKGRHSGIGKRKGTAQARLPDKVLWIRRARVLRRLLRKFRDNIKIDRHLYRDLYVHAKGNQFRNKRVLVEAIHKLKGERQRTRILEEAAAARKEKAKAKAAKSKKAVAKVSERSRTRETRTEGEN